MNYSTDKPDKVIEHKLHTGGVVEKLRSALGGEHIIPLTGPRPVKLTPAEADALRKAAQGKAALQTWVQMVQEQAENRIRAIIELEQKTMIDIQKQHGLDYDKVLWQFDPPTGQLVPTQLRLR